MAYNNGTPSKELCTWTITSTDAAFRLDSCLLHNYSTGQQTNRILSRHDIIHLLFSFSAINVPQSLSAHAADIISKQYFLTSWAIANLLSFITNYIWDRNCYSYTLSPCIKCNSANQDNTCYLPLYLHMLPHACIPYGWHVCQVLPRVLVPSMLWF